MRICCNPRLRILLLLLPAVVFLGACGMMSDRGPRPDVTPAPTTTPGGPATVSFQNDVRPILMNRCESCHGGLAGLYVDSFDTLIAGSSGGTVVEPWDPEGSLLFRRITGDVQPLMPLGGARLRPGEIDTIKTWIAEGAPNN